MSASRRRRRAEFENFEESQVSVEEANSSFRHKKQKTSSGPAARRQRAERSESQSDIEGDEEQDNLGHLAPTQYELLRDQGFEHLKNTEKDDALCTQLIQSRHAKNSAILAENRIAECGIIESIDCINFMCHEHLFVSLGPLLNFIVGENGSGKSAVLTSIIICLGGRAHATNRGDSLSSLIKSGTDRARITIILKNEGSGAYMPELYGNKIEIEREFTRKGSSWYKVKDLHGKSLPANKSTITDITDHFALQIGNPLSILSQDDARQFLNAASATQKYQYWVEGVNLQSLDQDYKVVQSIITDCESSLFNYQDSLARLKKKKNEAMAKKEILAKYERLEIEAEKLRKKLIWAQISDAERERDDAREHQRRAAAEVETQKEIIFKMDEMRTAMEARVVAAKEEVERLRENAKEYEDKTAMLKEAVTAHLEDRSKLHTEERSSKGALDRARMVLESKQQAILAEEARIREVDGGGLEELTQADKALENKLNELEARRAAKQQELSELEPRVQMAKRQLDNVARDESQKQQQIDQSGRRVEELKRGRYDAYAAFHPNTRNLNAAIERDSGFIEKPVGPIGLHIHLKQPKWAPLINKYLGGNLEAYVATSHQDNIRLRGLMQKMRMDNLVVTAKREALNTTGKEPLESVQTILRVLDFDDSVCLNPLIIGNSIEQVVLIPERREAHDYMFSAQGAPQNAKACLTFSEGVRGDGLVMLRSRDGFRIEPMEIRPNTKARLQISNSSQVTLEEDNFKALQQDLVGLQQERSRAKRAVEDMLHTFNQVKSEVRACEVEIRNAKAQRQKNHDKMVNLEGNDGRLQDLMEERVEAQAEFETRGRLFGEVALRKEEIESKIAASRAELDEWRKESYKHDVVIKKAEGRWLQLRNEADAALVRKNEAHTDLEDKIMAYEQVAQRVATLEEDAASLEIQAEAHKPRVAIEAGETYDKLKKQYSSLKTEISKAIRLHGDEAEEIRAQCTAISKQYAEAVRGFTQIEEDVRLLKKALMQRLDKWRNFQRSISAYTRTSFEMLLMERDFRGRVSIDHQKKKLSITVEPDKAQQDRNGGRNTKTLSGGEKSYSSLCLLLSIWEAMGSPLRCLDEFDVFMDNVNRAISTKLLINAARKSVGRQYIFITPNSIEGARAQLGADVKIHRLVDPRQKRVDHMMQGQ